MKIVNEKTDIFFIFFMSFTAFFILFTSCEKDVSQENNMPELRDVSVKMMKQWGSRGEGDGQFIIPNGLAILRNGLVLVVDCRNDRIQKFDRTGEFIEIIKPSINYTGAKPDEFKDKLRWPEGICSDSNGMIWVADTIRNHRAVQINAKGNVIQYIGGDGNSTHGSGEDLGSFLWPHGVAISGEGNLLVVSDTGNNRIQIFRTGHPDTPISHTLDKSRFYLMQVIGEYGKGPGQFSSPAGVLFDRENQIYVADYGNNRVQIFSEDGQFLHEFGKIGGRAGEFYHPYELSLSKEGLLAVSDFGNSRIQVFDKDGDIQFTFGKFGEGPGELKGPTGLAFDKDDNLFVADAFNHRIQVFSFDAHAEGVSIPANKESEESLKRRLNLPTPEFSDIGKHRSLSPAELGQWIAIDVYNDYNVYFPRKEGKAGYWGRGYYDWFPPFNTWSYHPLYRETASRIGAYIALYEITEEQEYQKLAIRGLNYLVSEQPEDGAYRWWASEKPSSEASFYVSGVVGEAFALGFKHFQDKKYLDALRRISDWACAQSTDLTNTNYNSFLNHPLALYYTISGERKYLDKAVKFNLESIPINMDESGAMKDAHNRKTVYHYIIVRGLIRLLSVMPPDHKDYIKIESLTRKMLKNLDGRQRKNGAFVSSPIGAEPSKNPFIVAPVLAYCMAETLLGWETDEEKIDSAISYLVTDTSHHDDKFVMRDYLIYRYQKARDRDTFCREFSKSLKSWRKKLEKTGPFP